MRHVRPATLQKSEAVPFEKIALAIRSGLPIQVEDLRAAEVFCRRQLVGPDRTGIELRRTILMRLWLEHFRGQTRTAAARLIAAEWKDFTPGQRTPTPGSKTELFERLHLNDVPRVRWRIIVDDLRDWSRREPLHDFARL